MLLLFAEVQAEPKFCEILGETMRDARRLLMIVATWIACAAPCLAKQVGDALEDMGDVGTTDPNGFKLMVFSIGMLFVIASTLIGVTVWYMLKGKKKTG